MNNDYGDITVEMSSSERQLVRELLIDTLKKTRNRHIAVLQDIFSYYRTAAMGIYNMKNLGNLFGIVKVNSQSLDHLRETVREHYAELNKLSRKWHETLKLLGKLSAREYEHYSTSQFEQLHNDDYLWRDFESSISVNSNYKDKIKGSVKEHFLRTFGDFRSGY